PRRFVVLEPEEGPAGGDGIGGVDRREGEGRTEAAGEPVPVVARIVATEGRAGQGLHAGGLEHGTEEERPPADGTAVTRRHIADLEAGEIGIGRGEVEPELDRAA